MGWPWGGVGWGRAHVLAMNLRRPGSCRCPVASMCCRSKRAPRGEAKKSFGPGVNFSRPIERRPPIALLSSVDLSLEQRRNRRKWQTTSTRVHSVDRSPTPPPSAPPSSLPLPPIHNHQHHQLPSGSRAFVCAALTSRTPICLLLRGTTRVHDTGNLEKF